MAKRCFVVTHNHSLAVAAETLFDAQFFVELTIKSEPEWKVETENGKTSYSFQDATHGYFNIDETNLI